MIDKPAFPRPGFRNDQLFEQSKYAQNGMTLREYAAIQAMQGLCSEPTNNIMGAQNTIAKEAVLVADALIKALDEK